MYADAGTVTVTGAEDPRHTLQLRDDKYDALLARVESLESAQADNMNTLHLIWICPVCALGGLMIAALLGAGRD